MPLEVVALETMMCRGSPGVTALETVAPNACRQARRSDRDHHRQCGNQCECRSFRMCKLVHGDTSLSPSCVWDGQHAAADSLRMARSRKMRMSETNGRFSLEQPP